MQQYPFCRVSLRYINIIQIILICLYCKRQMRCLPFSAVHNLHLLHPFTPAARVSKYEHKYAATILQLATARVASLKVVKTSLDFVVFSFSSLWSCAIFTPLSCSRSWSKIHSMWKGGFLCAPSSFSFPFSPSHRQL